MLQIHILIRSLIVINLNKTIGHNYEIPKLNIIYNHRRFNLSYHLIAWCYSMFWYFYRNKFSEFKFLLL